MRAPGSPRLAWCELPGALRSQIDEVLGVRIVEAVDQGGGFTPGCAARVVAVDGRRFFVKAVSEAMNEDSARLHRGEARSLSQMPLELPIARLVAVIDRGGWVALCLGDIPGRCPQTPWRAADLRAVQDALSSIAEFDAPATLPPVQEVAELDGWHAIAANPDGVDETWRGRLPGLLKDEKRARSAISGDRLVHCDIRADNVLLREDASVVIVDWASACRGAGWLDSLLLAFDCAAQGGPDPDEVLSAAPPARSVAPESLRCVVAALSGYFADRARRPVPPGLPTIREWQRHCAAAALTWHDSSRLWTQP